MTLKNFDGAVAVITGGASGIGLATAQACYTRGAHVVLADINKQRLQQAAQLVQQSQPSSSAQIVAVTTDVTDEGQVLALMHQALDISGHIDLVVTCAGLGLGGAIDDFTASEMQLIMNVNFMGTFHSVKAAVPSMRKQQSGHFVLLSSVAGKLCPPLMSGYTATKWAVRGFSSSLRAELYGTGIGITTVYPAWVDTPMVHQETSAFQSLNIEVLLTPQQVAEAIIQAVLEEKTDLTLAPNHDIAALLQIMQSDQDKAEQLAGAAFQQRMQQLLAQKSSE
jgi:NAD(P)-dependent dehydrogenase (short-subunit alcohol dehydrogenase family)